MAYKQKFVPVIAAATKTVLGYYTLAVETTFDGTETSITLAAGNVAIELWTPEHSNTRDQNPAMMAAVIDHAKVVSGDYKQYAEFMPVNKSGHGVQVTSASGAPGNHIQWTPGVVVTGLERGWNVTP